MREIGEGQFGKVLLMKAKVHINYVVNYYNSVYKATVNIMLTLVS